MRIKFILLCSLIFSFPFVFGQNLVPNPGFELGASPNCSYNSTLSQFNSSVSDWDSPTTTTPDIMSDLVSQSCWTYLPFSTWQSSGTGCNRLVAVSPRSGNTVASVFTYRTNANSCSAGYWCEYIQVELDSALVPGWEYYVEFWVALSSNSSIGTNNVGALLRTSRTSQNNCSPIVATPHVNASSPVMNTQTWEKISGWVYADSAYKFLILGNFDYLNTTSTSVTGAACPGSLYVVDDVWVAPSEPVSVEEIQPEMRLEVYPNPTREQLRVKLPNNLNPQDQISAVKVWNATGQVLECPVSRISGQEMELNTSELPSGVYFGQLNTGNAAHSFKFCVL